MTPQTKALIPRSLPEADQYGTYWLGEKVNCPAIFKSSRTDGVKGSRWYASAGDLQEEFGLLTDDSGIRYFDNPGAALKALRQHLAPLKISCRGGL